MPLLPGSYGGPQFNQQFFDDDGVPLALGSLTFYVTGTATPKNTYTTSARNIANLNPLALNAAGRATFFLTSGGYDIVLKNDQGDTVRTYLYVEDVGLTFLEGLGNMLTQGVLVTGTYTALPTDVLIRCDTATADVTINLPPAATRSTANNGNGLPLIIKNMEDNDVLVVPDGVETIDGETGTFTINVGGSSRIKPSIILASDAVSDYDILASHGLT